MRPTADFHTIGAKCPQTSFNANDIDMGNLRYRRTSDTSLEEEGFFFRLLAAAIAVPLFEVSLFLGIYAGGGSRGSSYFFLSIPAWVHIVYCGAAIAVGLVFGFRGLTWLLGHLFMTHFENERNERITVALWLAFLGLAGFGYWRTG